MRGGCRRDAALPASGVRTSLVDPPAGGPSPESTGRAPFGVLCSQGVGESSASVSPTNRMIPAVPRPGERGVRGFATRLIRAPDMRENGGKVDSLLRERVPGVSRPHHWAPNHVGAFSEPLIYSHTRQYTHRAQTLILLPLKSSVFTGSFFRALHVSEQHGCS